MSSHGVAGTEFFRSVARRAATLTGVLALVLAAMGLALDRDPLMLGAASAALYTVVAWYELGRTRFRPVIIWGVTLLITAVHFTVIDPAAGPTSGMIIVFLIGTLGLFLVERPRRLQLLVVAVLLVSQAWWFRDDLAGGAQMVMTPVAAYLLASWLLVRVRFELEAGEAEARELVRHAPVAIWRTDLSRLEAWIDRCRARGEDRQAVVESPQRLTEALSQIRVTDANEAAARLMGVSSRTDLVGPVRPEHLTPDRLDHYRGLLEAVWDGRADLEAAVGGSGPDGKRFAGLLRWHAPIVDGATDYRRTIMAITDVTELEAARHHLAELMVAKDRLVAAVSHELRNPLTGAVGLISELRTGLSSMDPATVEELVALIDRQGREMTTIVEDLLVAAQGAADGLRVVAGPVDLAAEVSQLLAEGGSTVRLEATAPVAAHADPVRVRQVVRNLVSNAQRYGRPPIRVVVCVESDGAVAEVRDAGPAIAEADRDRMFEAFGRASGDRQVPGSVGIGLAVARMLAERMGGTLTYHHDGAESVFRLTLPTVPSEPAAP